MALATLKGDSTLVELAERFAVHPNQITRWKSRLLESAADVFSSPSEKSPDLLPDLKELHAKIGQLTLENDFLAGALDRVGGSSAKR